MEVRKQLTIGLTQNAAHSLLTRRVGKMRIHPVLRKSYITSFLYLFAGIFLSAIGYGGYRYWRLSRTYEEKIVITAYYMQYACGDWNDDMQVQQVSHPKYNYLIGRDIDPTIGIFRDYAGEYALKDYFYANRTRHYGYSFRLTGYLHKPAGGGCDEYTSRFTVAEICRLDGKNTVTYQEF